MQERLHPDAETAADQPGPGVPETPEDQGDTRAAASQASPPQEEAAAAGPPGEEAAAASPPEEAAAGVSPPQEEAAAASPPEEAAAEVSPAEEAAAAATAAGTGLAARHGDVVPAPSRAPVPVRAAPPARRPEPSWGSVMATTVRLWTGRRLEQTRWRVLGGAVLAVLVFAAGAITVLLLQGSPATTGAGTSPGTATSPGSGTGPLAAAAAARQQAAAWISQQVASDEIVGCDPMMCAALQAAHIQANRILMLGASRADPLGSEVLVDTATLRSQFGPRLESVYAPVTLAVFGAGAARIEVRAAAPDGSATYLAQLSGDLAARRSAGREMLRNSHIMASPAARAQLLAGQVDDRLLVTLVTLADSHPVDIISFGTQAPGASPGIPLRSAEIVGAAVTGGPGTASVQALRAFLGAQQMPFRPSAMAAVQTASGRTALRIQYPAPSPLGLLGSHG